jgi:TonB family protein
MRSLLLSLFLILPWFLIAQVPFEEPKVFTFVEQMPEFPGGESALMRFLQQNIQYPQMERDNDIQGKVIVRFVVMEDGKVADVTVVRSVSPGLDKEAVRVIKMFPDFKPGRQQGKAVRTYYNVPIVYKLQDNNPKEDAIIKEKINKDENFRNAFGQYKFGKFDAAIKYLKKSIKKYPEDYLSYELRGECELKLGKKEEACSDYRVALQKGSTSANDLLKKNCN